VFVASREIFSGFDIERRMIRCPGKRKIATRVSQCLYNATKTSHTPDPSYEHALCAAWVGIERDLKTWTGKPSTAWFLFPAHLTEIWYHLMFLTMHQSQVSELLARAGGACNLDCRVNEL
jgi:hypothetical protein